MAFLGNVQLVAGNFLSVEKILRLLAEEGIPTKGNPDIYVHEYGSFGVEEARELSQRASSRAVSSERRIFVIVTPGMTQEAQNALLKTFEDPAGNALFFILVPAPHMLLPTLRSRAQMLSLESERSSPVDARTFLRSKSAARLEMLKPLLDKDEDDKRDISGSIAFLSSLEEELSKDTQQNREGLRVVYRARKFIGDKGSLAKALLEQVALLI